MPSLIISNSIVLGGGGAGGAFIQLSVTSIPEDTTVGTNFATISVVGGTGTYTFTETLDPDNKFTIASLNQAQLANTVDFEIATSHQWTLHADNGAGSILDRTFTINITDVDEGATADDDDWAAWVAAAA